LEPPRVNILGVSISSVNMNEALNTIESWIKGGQTQYVCVTPAHSVMDCLHNPELTKIINSSGLTTPDGMSIVWMLRLYGHKNVTRVYGPDLMLALSKLSSEKGYRQFFYGGAEGVAEELARELGSRYPGLSVVGTYTPPFRPLTPEEDHKVIELINSSEADIVWVGISSPKQEYWMASHVGKINAPVLIGVGAAFDFLSGRKRQAPYWMQRNGLEWLFRFISEPKRLWRRYIQYPRFVLLVLAQYIHMKSRPKDQITRQG
jgi:N-acetylglucosaminyldiphosphoundecaprenol N-acetyl-beta-D-mannosaminyltransferase